MSSIISSTDHCIFTDLIKEDETGEICTSSKPHADEKYVISLVRKPERKEKV